VFEHGIFHADLHPANLMILPGNVVGYVDFGITGTISPYSRQNLIAMTLAYTRGDLEAMSNAFLRVASRDDSSSIARFRTGLARAAAGWYDDDGRQRRLRKNFTLVMIDMLRLSRETGVWPERDVIKYIRSAIAIDGLITRFAPTFDLAKHLGSVCDAYLTWHVRHQLLTFDNLLGWATSNGHLLRDGGLRALKALAKYSTSDAADIAGAGGGHESAIPHQSIFFGTFLFTIGVAATASGEPARFGLNLFTVEAVLATGALALLLGNVRRLLKGR